MFSELYTGIAAGQPRACSAAVVGLVLTVPSGFHSYPAITDARATASVVSPPIFCLSRSGSGYHITAGTLRLAFGAPRSLYKRPFIKLRRHLSIYSPPSIQSVNDLYESIETVD